MRLKHGREQLERCPQKTRSAQMPKNIPAKSP
jgi:hypothetical protein